MERLRSRKSLVAVSCFTILVVVVAFYAGIFYSQVQTPVAPPAATRYEAEKSSLLPAPAEMSGEAPTERRVIYSGYVDLEVDDVHTSLTKIRAIAEGFQGYVSESSSSTRDGRDYGAIVVRVPREKFYEVFDAIARVGKVLSQTTSSEDVTQQYIDLEARLNNYKRQEQRLLEILDIATTVDEILRVENELARVRGEIESMTVTLEYLNRQVKMSTISVSLSTPPLKTFPTMNVEWTLHAALAGFFAVLGALIVVVVSILPLVAIGLPAFYLYKRRRARSADKRVR